jgi:hypothetical protein
MRLRTFGVLVLYAALFPQSPATAQSRDGKADLGANAALKYWSGFALLPSLDDHQEKLLSDWNKVPFDATALSLIDRSRNSREYLHQAARIEGCDWSLDYSQGIRLLMPHLVKSRTLAALVALHARHEFEEGHWQAGAEDVSDLLRFARHLELEPMMIQQLVAYNIERTAIDAAAPYLPKLRMILSPEVSDLFDTPPATPTLASLVMQEKQISAIWLIHELQRAEVRKPGSWVDVWKELFGETAGSEQNYVEPTKTLDESIKLLQELLPAFDELAQMASLPWKKFDEQYAAFAKKWSAANRFFGAIIPALDKFAKSQRRRTAQMELFKTAIAITEEGPDKVKVSKDPFGDGPFEYSKTDLGFELKSKLLVQDKLYSLTVGQKKK